MALDVVAKADEYCFLFIEWWPFCSTKSEWAAWVQAFAVFVALFVPCIQYVIKKCKMRELAHEYSFNILERIKYLEDASDKLKNNGTIFLMHPKEGIDEVLLKFQYFSHNASMQLDAVLFLSRSVYLEISDALGEVALRREIIERLKYLDDFKNNESFRFWQTKHQADQLDVVVGKLKKASENILNI